MTKITDEPKKSLSWSETDALLNRLMDKLRGRYYDLVILISRGGLVPGGIIAKKLGWFNIQVFAITGYRDGLKLKQPIILQEPHETMISGKTCLIIDDVCHSGDTIHLAKTMITRAGGMAEVAVIHHKPHLCRPDVCPDHFVEEIDYWAVYPWEPEDEREN